MSALTVPNELPKDFIVLSLDIIERKDALIERAYHLPITSVDEMRDADAHAKEIAALFKGVENQRLQLGRELKALQDRINVAAGDALQPLKQAWDDLVARIRGFEHAENARREAAAKKAREEAEARQREEEARAEAARQEQIRRAELETPPDDPAAAEPPPVTAEVLPRRIEAAPTPPPIRSNAYRRNGGKVVHVDSEAQIPLEINGVRLWKEPNLTAIKTLLAAGVAVPGCRLVENDGVAMAGVRR